MNRSCVLLLLGLLLPAFLAAQVDPSELLPADQAYAISATTENGEAVIAWDIADGYYMYRHPFRFTSENAELGEPVLPAGKSTVDEFFGETETYRDRVEARIPILSPPADGVIEIAAHSQGCADLGVCYPPHRQMVSLEFDAPLGPRASSAGDGGRAVSAERKKPSRSAVARPQAGIRDSGLGTQSSGRESTGIGQALSHLGQGDTTFTTREPPLPEEQAFVYEAITLDPATLLVRFTPQENYYLYRDQFKFRIEGGDDVRVVQAQLPEAESIHDEYFGDTWVYFGEVEIPVHLSRPAGAATPVELVADFQGCQKDGICYPPMQRTVAVDLPAAPEAIRPADALDEANLATAVPVSEQDRLAGALTRAPWMALGWFFLAGILLAFTPCVFPMVPILSGLIAGEGDRATTGRAFRLSLVYVLAMAVVYTAFGVVAGLFGQNLQAMFQHPAVLISFAALFVLLSFAMFGFYELQLPASVQTKLSEISNRQQSGTLWGAGIMGALSALVVGPCVAPALMGALIYIGRTGDAVLGGGALFSMALGMGVPLMVWGTSAGKLLPKAGPWMNAVKAVFGVGLLGLAIWMLERILPASVIMLLWGALAIACAVYLGALTRLADGVSGWRKLWQALGVMLLVVGVLQFIGAASGARHWSQPLSGLAAGEAGSPVEAPAFTKIDSVSELEQALATASGPVFLDFYADWCVDCRRMEVRTFSDPAVARQLAGFTLLKADVTGNTDEHRELLQHFGLIGPPAYLFFNGSEELPQYRMFGFVSPEQFVELLSGVAGQAGQAGTNFANPVN